MDHECERFAALLPAAADEELDDGEWEELERHLQRCPACRERLDREQRTVLELEGLDPDDLDRDLWNLVRPSLPREAKPSNAWPTWLIAIVSLGLCVRFSEVFATDFLGFGWSFAGLLVVVGSFLVARENPFRLASTEALGLLPSTTGGNSHERK